MYLVYPYGVLNIPVPFLQLYSPYSKHHILRPRNVVPNIAFLILGILAVTFEMISLLIVLPNRSHLVRVDFTLAYYEWFYQTQAPTCLKYPFNQPNLFPPVPNRCHIIDFSPYTDIRVFQNLIQCNDDVVCGISYLDKWNKWEFIK